MAESEGEAPAPPPDTRARYLARCLIADHGYVAGHVPEAAPLAKACDYILTGGDRVGLVIACIVDRDADPARRFSLHPDELDEIAAACRHHAGSMMGSRALVSIEIWEIGAGVPDAADRARFEDYTFRRRAHKGIQVKTYAVNTDGESAGDMVSTAGDGLTREPWVRKVIREPKRADADLQRAVKERQQAPRFRTKPHATYALLAAFALLYMLEVMRPLLPASGGGPHIATLLGFGALDSQRVDDGEWWRMFTCVFLHAGVAHILLNSVSMWLAGSVLENLIGRVRMLAVFFVSGVGGSLISMQLNERLVSVGASGAILGVMSAATVLTQRLPRGPARTQMMIFFAGSAILSLLPLSTGGDRVDYGAHLGGALTGALLGAALLFTWPRESTQPRAGKLAAVLAAAGILITLAGFNAARGHRTEIRDLYDADRNFVSNDVIPRTDADIHERNAHLLARYPRDPRLLFNAGNLAIEAGDYDLAITQYRRALAEDRLIDQLTNPDSFRVRIRYNLAIAYAEHHQAAQIPGALAPSCAHGKTSEDPEIRSFYQRQCP